MRVTVSGFEMPQEVKKRVKLVRCGLSGYAASAMVSEKVVNVGFWFWKHGVSRGRQR